MIKRPLPSSEFDSSTLYRKINTRLTEDLNKYNNDCTETCVDIVNDINTYIEIYNTRNIPNKDFESILMSFKDNKQYSLLLSVLNCDKIMPDVKRMFLKSINTLKSDELKQNLIQSVDPIKPDINIVSVIKNFLPDDIISILFDEDTDENTDQYTNLSKKEILRKKRDLSYEKTFERKQNLEKALIPYDFNKKEYFKNYIELLLDASLMRGINEIAKTFGTNTSERPMSARSESSTLSSRSVDSFSPSVDSSSVDSSSRSSSPSVDSPSARPPSLDYNEENNRVINYTVKSKPKPSNRFSFGKTFGKIGFDGGKKSRRKPKKKKRTIRRRTRQ